MYFTLTFTCTILLCKVVLVKDEYSTLITVTTDKKSQTSSFSLPAQFVVAMKCTRSNADGPICRKNQVLLYLCSLLLTLSYALEPNPGPRPIKFPCAVCNKAVKWSTPGVCLRLVWSLVSPRMYGHAWCSLQWLKKYQLVLLSMRPSEHIAKHIWQYHLWIV